MYADRKKRTQQSDNDSNNLIIQRNKILLAELDASKQEVLKLKYEKQALLRRLEEGNEALNKMFKDVYDSKQRVEEHLNKSNTDNTTNNTTDDNGKDSSINYVNLKNDMILSKLTDPNDNITSSKVVDRIISESSDNLKRLIDSKLKQLSDTSSSIDYHNDEYVKSLKQQNDSLMKSVFTLTKENNELRQRLNSNNNNNNDTKDQTPPRKFREIVKSALKVNNNNNDSISDNNNNNNDNKDQTPPRKFREMVKSALKLNRDNGNSNSVFQLKSKELIIKPIESKVSNNDGNAINDTADDFFYQLHEDDRINIWNSLITFIKPFVINYPSAAQLEKIAIDQVIEEVALEMRSQVAKIYINTDHNVERILTSSFIINEISTFVTLFVTYLNSKI